MKEIFASVREELELEGHELRTDIPLGIMVEIPAAVQIIDYPAQEIDFVSIGTNDLIQYTLAADRNNPRVKKYYDPCHPAVLHSIKRVADAAAKAGKKASVCGEMAADPLNALLMLGMGIREFSLSAPMHPGCQTGHPLPQHRAVPHPGAPGSCLRLAAPMSGTGWIRHARSCWPDLHANLV